MYRSFAQLREGWTKNLALLFPNPGWLAVKVLLQWVFPWAVLSLSLTRVLKYSVWDMVAILALILLLIRTSRANFSFKMTVLGTIFGIPMFAYLLLRSKRAHARGNVPWKGRTYKGEDHEMIKTANPTPTTAGRLS